MNTKTISILIITIVIIGAVMLGVRFLSGPEDTWICQNGEWVKHGNPSSFKPALPCEKNKKSGEAINTQEEGNDLGNSSDDTAENNVRVISPISDGTVSSPLEVTGEAKGIWFFEGSFPAKLVDEKGQTIAEAPATALGEWMTTDIVPFRAILEFSAPSGSSGTLILSRDDPSGQLVPEEVKIPVTFGSVQGLKIKLYLNSLYFDPESQDCEEVYEVERVVPKTKAVAKAALEELLGGITEGEKTGGYYTSINSGVALKSVAITNGVARADFDSKLGEGVGGACRTAAIRAQITQTLKQFPAVKSVVISIDGKTEGILQP